MDTLKGEYFTRVVSLLLAPITLLVIYFYCNHKLNYWKRRGVQQLKTTNKLFGDIKNGILFRTAPGYHLGEIYRQAPSDAPYVGFYIFHKPCLLVRDPKLIKQILVHDCHNFTNRHFAGSLQKDSIAMINLFSLKNPAWRYLRRKINPTFNKEKLKQMLPLMMETGKPMLDYLKENVPSEYDAKVMDAQDINYKYTADLIGNVSLGTKTNCFKNPDSEYAKYMMSFFHSFRRRVALVSVFYLPELVAILGSLILYEVPSFVQKIFWSAVESREKGGKPRGDYIDSVLQLKNGKQDPLFKFEGDNLFYQAGYFFSGFESGSITASFTLMELAKNKGYQSKAREDIQVAIQKHGWTIEAFNDMKYLDQCVAEGIRLHHAVSVIDRYTLEDYKIPNTDVTLEKGTPVFISLYGLHRDPQYFDEPEVYNPDRFDGDRNISEAYIPFGIGPRKCIGIKFGQLNVKVLLSMILSEYEVYQKPTKTTKLDSRFMFTAAADGINLEFSKIS